MCAVVRFSGLHNSTKRSLEDVAMCTAAASYVKLLIPKLSLEAKTAVFTPVFKVL